jgi:hypothetical protein
VQAGSRARLFFSAGTGAANLTSGGIMGQRITFRKSPLNGSPRAPENLGDILHAAMAQLPRLNGRNPPPFLFGQGLIKIPHVLFDRRFPCLRKDKCHRWPPNKWHDLQSDQRGTFVTEDTKKRDTNSSGYTW